MGAETKMNSEDIKQLLETKPYHKEIAPQLEEYVGEQIGKGVADLDANTALLKLYQFYPELAKVAVVRKILVLALMSLPASDFQLCLFLVSEKVQEEAEIASIVSAWEQLETTSSQHSQSPTLKYQSPSYAAASTCSCQISRAALCCLQLQKTIASMTQ